MKKSLLFLFSLICSMSLFTACSEEDTSWQEIPTTEIKGENIVLTINEQTVSGSIALQATNNEQGVLTMSDVISGYPTIIVPVVLTKQADESFNFTGSAIQNSVSTKVEASDFSTTTTITVKGNITKLGKATLEVSTEAAGALVGTWILPDSARFDEDGKYLLTSPILINWPAAKETDDYSVKNGEQLARVAGLVGPFALQEVLNQVSFNANGSITAKYYPTIILEEDQDIKSWMMAKIFANETKFIPSAREWKTSPANLASWYMKGDKLYVTPNIAEILKLVSKNENGATSDFSAITKMLETLSAADDATLRTMVDGFGSTLGVDLSKLDIKQIREVLGWLKTGIPFKYRTVDNLIYIYVDKDMVAPFMPIVLSLLPKLQAELDKLAETDPQMGILPIFLGVDKLTDFETVWNTNTTKVFELGIMLKK